MNLHELAPELFSEGEKVDFDLDKIYKERSRSSHLDALETIFEMGFEYALERMGMEKDAIEARHEEELFDLQERFDALELKHENLKAQIAAQRDKPTEEVTQKAVEQTMGMGRSFLR